jgi:hypothetical protein
MLARRTLHAIADRQRLPGAMEMDSHPLGFPTTRTVRLGIATMVIKRIPEFEFFLKCQLPLQFFDPFVCPALIPRKINNFFFEL